MEGKGGQRVLGLNPTALKIYYANITSLSQNAKAFIKELPDHVVCLAETHVVKVSSLKQFANQIGRKVYQKSAKPTVRHYSSGGEAILPLNYVSTAPVPQAADFPFAVSFIRLQKLTIMLGVFYARPGPEHPDAIEEFFSAVGLIPNTQTPQFLLVGDFNCTPDQLSPQRLNSINAIIKSPTNCTTTLKTCDSRVIDYCVVSKQIAHLVNVSVVHEGPWAPHHALRIVVNNRPMTLQAQYLKVPKPLPMQLAIKRYEELAPNAVEELWNSSIQDAKQTLCEWDTRTGFAIMGRPSPALTKDTKYSKQYLADSVKAGEELALAALSTEKFVLSLAEVPKAEQYKFLGRSQFPRFVTQPLISKCRANYLYLDPLLNILYETHSILSAIHNFLSKHKLDSFQHPSGYPSLDSLYSQYLKLNLNQVPNKAQILMSPEGTIPKRVVLSACTACAAELHIKLKQERNNSSLKYRKFVKQQLFKGGASLFQSISKQEKLFLNVSLDGLGEPDQDPQQKMEQTASSYFSFWDPDPDTQLSTRVAFNKGRQEALEGPPLSSLTPDNLRHAAKIYKKRSKGSDHWVKEELLQLPSQCIAEIASSLNTALNKLVQPYQSLLNLNPLLGKPKGHRTICKTPMLYRFVCKHMQSIAQWEAKAKAPHDACIKGSSASLAATARITLNEAYVVLGHTSINILNDFSKFFDTVDPATLIQQALATGFPSPRTHLGTWSTLGPQISSRRRYLC